MDWEDFAGRLTRELSRLADGCFVIVQGTTGLPYTQAIRTAGALEAEAVGSDFLPKPLTARQQRRLAALGWEEPDGRDRRNWSFRLALPGSPRDFEYLAGRMVAAFRDVYGLRGPLELVYQAGGTRAGEGLALPGLGIPAAVPEGEDAAPAKDVESGLAAARKRGDQRRYLRLLTGATLYLPAGEDVAEGAAHQYATAQFGDETFVLAFTSPEAMSKSLRGQAQRHRAFAPADLAAAWPHPEWRLAVNPGLPSAAFLDAAALRPAERAKADGKRSAEPRPRPGTPAAAFVIMQKVVRPEHVAHYLDGGYDRVAGYVHRVVDVRRLDSPGRIVRALGLTYEGAPFGAADEELHVIRWPAVKPALFRTPLGGIDEWSMGIVPGGWVIEKAPFPGSGYAPGEGAAIPEFKINSQRLPHGAEMYRIGREGSVTLVAGYDADRRQWRRTAPPSPGGGR
ncbi:TY-Chap domain-containing protein [Actinomadura parmotrematis]|uniref:SseB family protein n=1 Tax=Actinomadura parmotrematis TaxID=2864039 RepID=A0ABS7FWX1_9ACTN|nr:SseB family protein [Actinomadura parmotrematis]MBW8484926.1 SseB family protein [Actinomadura parmotrematis]